MSIYWPFFFLAVTVLCLASVAYAILPIAEFIKQIPLWVAMLVHSFAAFALKNVDRKLKNAEQELNQSNKQDQEARRQKERIFDEMNNEHFRPTIEILDNLLDKRDDFLRIAKDEDDDSRTTEVDDFTPTLSAEVAKVRRHLEDIGRSLQAEQKEWIALLNQYAEEAENAFQRLKQKDGEFISNRGKEFRDFIGKLSSLRNGVLEMRKKLRDQVSSSSRI